MSASGGGGGGAAKAAEGGEQRDALGRRVWDKEEFERKAKERAREEAEAAEGAKRGAILGVKRDLLRGREKKVDLTSRVGKSRAISSAQSAEGGYYCKHCDCVLRDSMAWLNHINGKKHQRVLGMSMKVERSTVDQVKERLAARKRQIEKVKEGPEEYNLDARVAALQEEEEERLRQKKEAKRRRKQEEKERKRREEEEKAAELGVAGDDDVATMMGFGGFGSSKK